MLAVQHHGPARPNCQGLSRRAAVRAGLLGLGGLTLPDLYRAQAATPASTPAARAAILVWLDGGPSQLETFDPKPDAPVEFRGPFGTVPTRTPGVRFSELVPELAALSDKFATLRTVSHGTGDHFAGGHVMLTGRPGATGASTAPRHPGLGAYVSRLRGPNHPALPAYVGLPSAQSIFLFPGYHGASYLGSAYNPFEVNRQERYLGHVDSRKVGTPAWLSAFGPEGARRLSERSSLLGQFDGLRAELDARGTADAVDAYQRRALDLLLGSEARFAFDLDREDVRLSDRYGTGPWGRYTLMARRLVEAGVTFVTVDMPHWDDHSSLVASHAPKIRAMQRAVAALIRDLDERGLLDTTLVMVAGEFGRTPRLNQGQPGIPVPGRDHWGESFCVLLAGGGIKGGITLGRSSAKAEYPVERKVTPQDVLATVYRQLGIDPSVTFPDHGGRPLTVLDGGEAIREIL